MEHMNKGGSYVIGADGVSKLVERGGTEAALNTAVVVVPEHEAEKAKAEAADKVRASRRGGAAAADAAAAADSK